LKADHAVVDFLVGYVEWGRRDGGNTYLALSGLAVIFVI
jgi:hypothetical protein